MVIKSIERHSNVRPTDDSTSESVAILTPLTKSLVMATPVTDENTTHSTQQRSTYDARSLGPGGASAERSVTHTHPLSPEDMATVHQYMQKFTCLNPLFKGKRVPEIQIKAIMFGDYDVGMSSLATRFLRSIWLVGYNPDKYWGEGWTKLMHFHDKRITLEMLVERPDAQLSVVDWPAGTPNSYCKARHCEACVLVYDVTSRASFEAARSYYRNFCQERARSRSDCPDCFEDECPPRPSFQGLTFVFANKIDRDQAEWQVPREEGQQFADSVGPLAHFLPMSMKTGEGCGSADVDDVVRRIILRRCQSPPFFAERVSRVEIEKSRSKREGPLIAQHAAQLYWY